MECQCVCFRLDKWFVIPPLSLSFKWIECWFGTSGMQGGQNMGSLPNHTPTHLLSFFFLYSFQWSWLDAWKCDWVVAKRLTIWIKSPRFESHLLLNSQGRYVLTLHFLGKGFLELEDLGFISYSYHTYHPQLHWSSTYWLIAQWQWARLYWGSAH